MAKEIKGDDGKTYVVKSKKSWYKRWWVWVLIALAVIIVFALISSGGSDDDDSSSSNNSTNTAKRVNTKTGSIELDGQDIEYTNSKKFKVANSEDTSWEGATATVNSVTIYKTKSGYSYGTKSDKKEVQGLLALSVTVKAIKDIEVLMNIGTISIPSINEQHDVETKEDWGDLDKGMSKTGTVYVPIYKLDNVNSIKSLRFKFDGQLQDTDDADEDMDNYDHTYDITVNFN